MDCSSITDFQQSTAISIAKKFRNLHIGKWPDQLIDILEKEEDFASAKTLLEEELEKIGALCIFTLKFHPELNPVESRYRLA